MLLNVYIKCTQNIMCPLYIKFFNKIFDTGVFPSEWQIGLNAPFYKNKGDINDVNNFRRITLLSYMGKLFTSIVSEGLM